MFKGSTNYLVCSVHRPVCFARPKFRALLWHPHQLPHGLLRAASLTDLLIHSSPCAFSGSASPGPQGRVG